MRRAVGMVLAVVSTVVGVILWVAGQLPPWRVAHIGGGGTPTSRWDVVDYEVSPNWLLAVPLTICFLAGLLLAILPRRR
jgi:hypothetical protein